MQKQSANNVREDYEKIPIKTRKKRRQTDGTAVYKEAVKYISSITQQEYSSADRAWSVRLLQVSFHPSI